MKKNNSKKPVKKTAKNIRTTRTSKPKSVVKFKKLGTVTILPVNTTKKPLPKREGKGLIAPKADPVADAYNQPDPMTDQRPVELAEPPVPPAPVTEPPAKSVPFATTDEPPALVPEPPAVEKHAEEAAPKVVAPEKKEAVMSEPKKVDVVEVKPEEKNWWKKNWIPVVVFAVLAVFIFWGWWNSMPPVIYDAPAAPAEKAELPAANAATTAPAASDVKPAAPAVDTAPDLTGLPAWPTTAEAAAKLFGGTADRWEATADATGWHLTERAFRTSINPKGYLAEGYFDTVPGRNPECAVYASAWDVQGTTIWKAKATEKAMNTLLSKMATPKWTEAKGNNPVEHPCVLK
jgi:hypothetical protein